MSKITLVTIKLLLIYALLNIFPGCVAQSFDRVVWRSDGKAYFRIKNFSIIEVSLPDKIEQVVAPRNKLLIAEKMVNMESLSVSADDQQFLIFLNTKKNLNYVTKGDYWIYNRHDSSYVQLGKILPSSSLMFAKISPDGKQAAYVSGYNLYAESLSDHQITPLTYNGNSKLFNGMFDWVYQQEFDCRDGFRWSPDSKRIAFWRIDASEVRDYDILNTTDSVYPKVNKVTTPVAGDPPSSCRIGVIKLSDLATKWMDIQTDTGLKSYIPRMEWSPNSEQIIVQHLNRRQNNSRLMICDVNTGKATTILEENDSAWINIQPAWDDKYRMGGWDWMDNGKSFIWTSEKDGWRHLYEVSSDGKNIKLITPGPYDVLGIERIDEAGGSLYFLASPENATQAYLYRLSLKGKSSPKRVSPVGEEGTHEYDISPAARFALHNFSNYYTYDIREWLSLPDHHVLSGNAVYSDSIAKINKGKSNIRYFKINTQVGVQMDGWERRPLKFDSTKKYPVVFFVYSGPAEQTVIDRHDKTWNFLYDGDMSEDGYIYISIDNRGTPAPKGAAWRRAVYGRMGSLDIGDQAAAARQILKWPYVDTNRIAVWGWSNGGTATLNLMFQYPDIYKTGIAISAITNYLYYDNIWMEHVMGLPKDNMKGYIAGSPITWARNLKGHLLLIHGSGDDNVHYKHAELLINEFIKYNKVFQFMEYPNRDHNIFDSNATRKHLSNIYTNFLREYCPPGPLL